MDTKALESIGLTNAEAKVYLALLELGASSTGPLVRHSRTADSKIYEVLDKLMAKGLASAYVEDNVKRYRAAPPKMIMDYLQEKKRRVEEEETAVAKLLPRLELMTHSQAKEKEVSIFSGPKGVRTAFAGIVDALDKGEEVRIMGVYEYQPAFLRAVERFHTLRSDKGVKARVLISSSAPSTARLLKSFRLVEIRSLPESMFTPAIFIIYKGRVIIHLGDEFTMFLIKSESANRAFGAYFEMIWAQAKKR